VSAAPVGALHLHVAGHGQGVRCPSPWTMKPLPPHSVQQPGLGGSGVGSGAFSCAVVAYAAETAAEALGASRSICAGSAASDARTDSSHCHMITTLARD
jgi:hypothetical protein